MSKSPILVIGSTGKTGRRIVQKLTQGGHPVRAGSWASMPPFDWDRPETWGGALDRCPCGTGTSAKMAALYARGQLALGDTFVHQGPLGTTFEGRILSETSVGEYAAIVPEIRGQGWITGIGEYLLEETDPFPEGYTIGDIWS